MLGIAAIGSVVLASALVPPSEPVQVAGGAEVAVCGWPTAVRMQGNCSGTLIHPQVVLYAAHCGTGSAEIIVGETQAEGTPYATDGCWANPMWGGSAGTDFAVCRLAAPVPQVPIVPIMMGCETQLLEVGLDVTTVGFGNAPDGPNGIKRAITYPIVGLSWDENFVAVGGGKHGTLCSGDSGGGTFVQAHDGSWRVVAVSSGVSGGVCDDGVAVLGLMPAAVPWVEEVTGIDVTPCTDADGTWNPGPDCTSAPLDPATGGGMWPRCEWGPLSGPISSCGPPVVGDDLVAPTIAIVDPLDGAQLPLDPDGTATTGVEIEVSDGDGFGVALTWLRIDGADLEGSEDDFPPWELPTLQFPEGVYLLEAVAEDWAGNQGVSASVMLIVGEPPLGGSSTGSGDGTGDDTTSSGSSSGDTTQGAPGSTGAAESTGDGAAEAEEGDEPSGCGCRGARSDRATPLLLLLLLLGLHLRERSIR